MSPMYDFAEAAEQLGCEERWLRDNSARLPRTKFGRRVRFTEADLERIREMHHVEPGGASQHKPEAATAGQLKPLPARRALRSA